MQLLGGTSAQTPAFHDDWQQWLRQLFPMHASAGFGPHHAEFWRWAWDIAEGVYSPPRAEIWPRGGAKSTTAEMFCVALGARRVRRYVLYVCGKQEQADDHVLNIADMLEQPTVAEWYPALAQRHVGKYGQSKGWRRNRLWTASGLTIDAVGLDTAARGAKLLDARPDAFVLDDLDNEADTAAITKRKLARLTRALLPAGTEDAVVVAIQNLILPDGIFSKLLPGYVDPEGDGLLADRIAHDPVPALYEMESERDPDNPARMLVRGRPAWVGQDVAACQRFVNRYGFQSFLIECQHDVLARGDVVVKREWYANGRNRYETDPDVPVQHTTSQKYISIDAADEPEGVETAYSVIGTADLRTDRRLELRHIHRQRLSLPQLVRATYAAIDAANTRGQLREVFIEAAGNGRALIQILLAEDKLPRGVRIVPIKPRLPKPVRARQASRWMEQGAFLLPKVGAVGYDWLPDFEDEFFTFPNGQYADQMDVVSQLINALAAGRRLEGA